MKIIKLFDGSEIEVSDEQADQIKEAIKQDEKYIEVGENLIRISAIASVRGTGWT